MPCWLLCLLSGYGGVIAGFVMAAWCMNTSQKGYELDEEAERYMAEIEADTGNVVKIINYRTATRSPHDAKETDAAL